MWRFGNITLCIALILAGHRDPNESAFVWLQEKAAPDTYPSSTNRTCHLPPHHKPHLPPTPSSTNRTVPPDLSSLLPGLVTCELRSCDLPCATCSRLFICVRIFSAESSDPNPFAASQPQAAFGTVPADRPVIYTNVNLKNKNKYSVLSSNELRCLPQFKRCLA